MKVTSYPDVESFWRAAEPLLTADPVRNTVAITIISRLLAGGRFADTRPVFLTVHDDGTLIGAALCTPPFPIGVSAVPPSAAAVLADHLVANGITVTGASGIRPEVEAFAAAWGERTGAGVARHMDQRLYRLDRLVPPTGVAGEPALAGLDDVELLTDWRIEFTVEAEPTGASRWTRESMRNQVLDSLAAGNASVLWLADGKPVSLAAVGSPKSGMSRVGPVYTPKEFRAHGYGSAVTAAAASWALSEGAANVLLFTDLSNPTSNSIYQRVGFVPVMDALDVSFT